jgi:hypothetical protein
MAMTVPQAHDLGARIDIEQRKSTVEKSFVSAVCSLR